MDIEKLFEEVIESNDDDLADCLFDALVDHWVHFYFHETNGKDTKPGIGNVDVVIFIGKDNPINIPMVENDLGINGVVYTNSDLAGRMAKFDCKVAKSRGMNAFEILSDTENFGGIYLQSEYGHIHINKEKVNEIIDKNS